jgi:hypothetical protein
MANVIPRLFYRMTGCISFRISDRPHVVNYAEKMRKRSVKSQEEQEGTDPEQSTNVFGILFRAPYCGMLMSQV